jgi:hypothetical protein
MRPFAWMFARPDFKADVMMVLKLSTRIDILI